MNKKDYILIAATIQSTWRNRMAAHKHTNICVCTLMANALEKENPAFQRGKFLQACLPPEDACEQFSPSRSRGTCRHCGIAKKDHA